MVAGGDSTPKVSQLPPRLIAGVCASSTTMSGVLARIADTSRESSTHSAVISGSHSTIEQMSLRLTASGSATKTRMGALCTWPSVGTSTAGISGKGVNGCSPSDSQHFIGQEKTMAELHNRLQSDLARPRLRFQCSTPRVTAGGRAILQVVLYQRLHPPRSQPALPSPYCGPA